MPPFLTDLTARRTHVRTYALALLTAFVVSACHRSASAPPVAAAPAASAAPTTRSTLATREGTPTLPDRLDDSTFWRMSREFSEPGGYFRSENFVSNEMGLQHVIAQLETYAPPGGVYVGVGPEQNFTYIAALRPRIAFIVDIRRQNLLQHLWYKAVFELSPTRASFLARLFSRPAAANAPEGLSADSLISVLNQAPVDLRMFEQTFAEVKTQLLERHHFTIDSSDLATLHYVDSIFVSAGPMLNYSSGVTGGGGFGRGGFSRMPTFAQVASATDERGVNRGFLGSEASYRVVREMQQRNLIVPVVGDFGGPKALSTVGAWIRERGARVNVFYTSNVEQYLFQSDAWSRFYTNVGTMPLDSSSRFIRSATGRGFGSAGQGGFLMTQMTSSIQDVVGGARTGTLRSYWDVLQLSRP